MIYPEIFPEERNHEHAEKKAYESLKALSDKYDIFYSKSFVTDGLGKKPEYEIDFIIAIPEKAVFCLEVKGGLIRYDGTHDVWYQNSKLLKKRPDRQSQTSSHALLNLFKNLISEMPLGWGLCFPGCQLIDRDNLPHMLSKFQIIDEQDLLYLESSLPRLFDFIQKQYPAKRGIRKWQYEKFKKQLLRDIGFVQILSTKIKFDENRFIKLTDQQLKTFLKVSKNTNVLTSGPAGSGKTIIAKTLAQDFSNNNLKVLFLCYNRTLANKIRYDFDKYDKNIDVFTFHSLARNVIEKTDNEWWDINKKKEDFWELEVPIKFESIEIINDLEYDVLIVDEGQDFKELWFDVIFKLIKPEGKKFIFIDQMQDIFERFTNLPGNQVFASFSLDENCRNTKNIVQYLSETIDKEIEVFDESPVGDSIVLKNFKNQLEEQKCKMAHH